MSWKEASKSWGPENLTFLSTKDASITGIIVADPVMMQGMYNKQVQERIACPMVTDDGFYLLVIGKRVARKLVTLEGKFATHLITITRLSPEGDPAGKYTVVDVDDKEHFAKLKGLASKCFSEDVLNEAVKEAQEVVGK